MNWQKIIHDLENSGLRQYQIAKLSNCSQGTISFLSTGKQASVKYQIGEALLKLHKDLQKNQ
ncbi:helix-turn-helix domain-containing protein [Stenoxybacter acetivorans]|uniref:helix-turn-helix domain-containing protein n=1 Tax=Stenoxybacter acetivorans TaxID=422441 RepID=UPI00055ADE81|nr:helix-turn-helix transcriptional regulator [Stenoxybacter acetivorans]